MLYLASFWSIHVILRREIWCTGVSISDVHLRPTMAHSGYFDEERCRANSSGQVLFGLVESLPLDSTL